MWKFVKRVGLSSILVVGVAAAVTSPNAPEEFIEDATKLGYGTVRVGRVAVTVGQIMWKYYWLPQEATNEQVREVHRYGSQKALEVVKKNGGVYIKLGQHMAALQFIIPEEYYSVMRCLQDAAPQVSYEEASQVVCEDLGLKTLEEKFRFFEKTPIASASLAQVHRAETLEGERLAVKIQYPFLRKTLAVDMATIRVATDIIVRFFPNFEFRWVADQFGLNLPLEIDFVNEGRNAERAAKLLENNQHVVVPKIYWNLTSKRVLTMEFMDGCPIDNRDMIRNHYHLDTVLIGKLLSKVFSELIFIHGVVHADPHPGNILVRRNPATNQAQLVLLDHGLYRNIPNHLRLLYCQFWRALLTRNFESVNKVANEIIKLGNGRSKHKSEFAGGSAESDARLFTSIVLARSWSNSTDFDSTNISPGEQGYLREQATVYVDKIATVLDRVPSEFLLLFKTNDLLRSVNKNLGAPINGFAKVIFRDAVRGSEESSLRRIIALWQISFLFFLEELHRFIKKWLLPGQN